MTMSSTTIATVSNATVATVATAGKPVHHGIAESSEPLVQRRGERVHAHELARERGSVLVLALVFLLVGSLIIGALASWTTGALLNTKKFQNASSLLYAAGGVTQVAVWNARYVYPPLPAEGCPGTNPAIPVNGQYIADWCVTTFNVSPTITRQVVISACYESSATTLQHICSNPLLTATVNFDDNTAANSINTDCIATNPTNCGLSMTVIGWKIQEG